RDVQEHRHLRQPCPGNLEALAAQDRSARHRRALPRPDGRLRRRRGGRHGPSGVHVIANDRPDQRSATAGVGIIVNPKHVATRRAYTALSETLRDRAVAYRTMTTTAVRDGRWQAEQLVDWGAEVVIVLGGDGTIRAAAPVLAEAGILAAVVPTGTANVLSRHVGLGSTRQASAHRLRIPRSAGSRPLSSAWPGSAETHAPWPAITVCRGWPATPGVRPGRCSRREGPSPATLSPPASRCGRSWPPKRPVPPDRSLSFPPRESTMSNSPPSPSARCRAGAPEPFAPGRASPPPA